jgi:hypothetical protein
MQLFDLPVVIAKPVVSYLVLMLAEKRCQAALVHEYMQLIEFGNS